MNTINSRGFRDKLSMIDSKGGRIPLFPAEARGVWKNRRTAFYVVLMVIFLILPWTHMNGTQTILIDLVRREFSFFGLKFWAHDGPLVFFLLGLAAIGLFGATAIFGRVWCGWACPQTVFLDGVYRRIETWIEGSHLKRRELARAPWGPRKIFLKVSKFSAFFAITFVITHSFLAYFVGSENLIGMITSNPTKNWGSFIFIGISMSLLFFNFVWFREQLCLIVCPYGRFQSVLYDKESVTVQYDAPRGEPRKGFVPQGENQGSCVNCLRCVQVCPTGIDIRNGVQMECIACTACIDACDEIMDKVKQPRGLIRYMNSAGTAARYLRPRTFAYVIIWLFFLVGLIYNLGHRKTVEVSILRALDLPYFTKVDENQQTWVVNTYRVHAHNQTGSPLELRIDWVEPEFRKKEFKLEVPKHILTLKPNEFKMVPFVIEAKKEALTQGDLPLKLLIQDQLFEVRFVGPNN